MFGVYSKNPLIFTEKPKPESYPVPLSSEKVLIWPFNIIEGGIRELESMYIGCVISLYIPICTKLRWRGASQVSLQLSRPAKVSVWYPCDAVQKVMFAPSNPGVTNELPHFLGCLHDLGPSPSLASGVFHDFPVHVTFHQSDSISPWPSFYAMGQPSFS